MLLNTVLLIIINTGNADTFTFTMLPSTIIIKYCYFVFKYCYFLFIILRILLFFIYYIENIVNSVTLTYEHVLVNLLGILLMWLH